MADESEFLLILQPLLEMNMEHVTQIIGLLWQLLGTLGSLALELVQLGGHWALALIWAAWWVAAVNWKKAWPILGRGGWAPLLLLWILTALVWSKISPADCACCGLPNFWWQLGYVGTLIAIAFFCGWLQGIFGWTPAHIDLDPPAHGHGGGHDHH